MKQGRKYAPNSVSFSFEGDIAEQVGKFFDRIKNEALRPAAHAMAMVLYDEMRSRVPVEMGTLQQAIYRWFDEKDSGSDRKTYLIGVNKRKAPHWWLVEHGHWRRHAVIQLPSGAWVTVKSQPLKVPVFVPAKPYLRVSVDAKLSAAVEAGRRRLAEKIQDIQNARKPDG
ncbi:hypothetical protein CAL29_28090 [Bordetella genomosp. 10]|uniref:HK97 gp10 family phage protein n=1 Tax=Bordetella genomosp. 10 TaxID=1416804 RepID=A0A261S317_9BORD|nr:HK97 gp10 family phage protein [Bordetella genomosp. 10]OZI31736.1 hypothetical protein CAL29_28090 [Bordetella genomosp. 10]